MKKTMALFLFDDLDIAHSDSFQHAMRSALAKRSVSDICTSS